MAKWTFRTLRTVPTAGASAEDKCDLLEDGSQEQKDCDYDAVTRRSSPNAGKTNTRVYLVFVVLLILGAIVGVVVALVTAPALALAWPAHGGWRRLWHDQLSCP